ncbi:Arm DNA-binding domain-containing protein [Xenorhabdus vietnamensis]|nr:Arm DNA-binding domain-containing protein [Xenorhabdus vietnamensis]
MGTFPLITLAEARKKRDEAKKLIVEGIGHDSKALI